MVNGNNEFGGNILKDWPDIDFIYDESDLMIYSMVEWNDSLVLQFLVSVIP